MWTNGVPLPPLLNGSGGYGDELLVIAVGIALGAFLLFLGRGKGKK